MSGRKITTICAMGVALNLIGSIIASQLGLPIYMDTMGTIAIAALGGYVPGIIVGFSTNLINTAAINTTQLYFSSVSIFIAVITTYFARKGYYDDFNKAIRLIPLLTLVAGVSSVIIETLLPESDSLTQFENLSVNVVVKFAVEFIDKTIAVLVAYKILQRIDSQIKESFIHLGLKQAALSEEMEQLVSSQQESVAKFKTSSVRTKMLLILMLSSLFLSASIASISYILFKESVIDERVKIVDTLMAMVVNEINPYRIDDFLTKGNLAAGYRETEAKLYTIKNSSFNMKYLYVYRVEEDGCHVIFDLDTPETKGDKPGEVKTFDKEFLPYFGDFLEGKPIPPIISNNEYGYLLTIYRPIYDMYGKCQCYVGIDFSMEILSDYMRTFIVKLVLLFLGFFFFIFALGFEFVENNIVLPVNTMAYCAQKFAENKTGVLSDSAATLNNLGIRTGDEIENLYKSLIKMTTNILEFIEKLQHAKARVANMQVKVEEMDELAHKDAMTGIKNKAAYDETTAALNQKIEEQSAKFCIVMVDVNFLKKINDTYGHEYGNEYLINAARLVCTVFGEENVYRIGGDEFVAVLEDDKVDICKYFVAQIRLEMDRKKSNEGLAPWEKISAAVGVAFYEPETDKTAEEVFKRADAQMYENKLAMKAQRTD
ncbi:MAG: GGDEF domain-containing protein [Selenomonadaceae bacterium]|nr:GGDEF domain-containing protein [Selenomonadaceae bacterium]